MRDLRRHKRPIAMALCFLQLFFSFSPLTTFAGGPSAPEMQQFSAAENTELVNLFTGDLNYQIPLLDVGGYPLTLSYSSNVAMESEATMVGLGWNLNTGSISRDVRGLPDDFNGDRIEIHKHAKPRETTEIGIGLDVEFTGWSAGESTSGGGGGHSGGEGEMEIGLGAGLVMEHDTYEGWSAGVNLGVSLAGKGGENVKGNGKLSTNFSLNSSKGATVNADVSASMDAKVDADESIKGGIGYGLAVDSRNGIKKHYIKPDIAYGNRRALGNTLLLANKSFGISNGVFKAGGSFNIGYNSPGMSPNIPWPMYEDGFTGQIKPGFVETNLITLTGDLEFSYTNQRYATNFDAIPAYGFMYAHNATGGRETMDVLREKGSRFSKEIPNLPMAQFAHDIFNVNVQGIQTSFRPFRGDIGTLYDPQTSSLSARGGLGFDIAGGDILKIGVNVQVPIKHGESKKWESGNEFADDWSFKEQVDGNPLFEPVYFKSMGEAVAMANPDQFNSIGDFRPVRTSVNDNGTTTSFLTSNGRHAVDYRSDRFVKQNREFRQTNFQWLTANDAQFVAFDRYITSHPTNVFKNDENHGNYHTRVQHLDRSDDRQRPSDHISEVNITRTDGTRFVFGIPTYNWTSVDVSFNISKEGAEKDDFGMVEYTPGVDNSGDNHNGENHGYECERTPAHAYGWLLTDMLSPDYVDLTGNGPSSDDLGSYTKFNYTRAQSDYKWRFPVQENMAIFREGDKTSDEDNMANYSAGRKELWYVHSIETKNYIAEFTYSDREDAVGVKDENGGLDTRSRMKKLDKIELYTKASRLEADPVPVKTVHFQYDYSLCSGVPSNISGGGKLTLKKVWFEYGSSEKGSRNPYLFTYNPESNPTYHNKQVDRWGCYIDGSSEEAKSYVALSKEDADRYAASWLLTKVITPTGSSVEIAYESDDYAYVQNRRAMENMTIVGVTDKDGRGNVRRFSDGEERVAELYDHRTHRHRNYVQFKLKQPLDDAELLREYFEGISELYFSMNVDLNNHEREEKFEKVEGFVPISAHNVGSDFGLCEDHRYAWLRLPLMHKGDEMRDLSTFATDMENTQGVNPIAKAAWEKIRKGYTHFMYNEPLDPHSPEALGTAFENCFNTLGEYFHDANTYLENGGHGSEGKLKGAKIRLNTFDKVKFGGGARVKRVTVNDEWGNMVQNPELNFSYNKEYTYTTSEMVNGISRAISSGVAQYEPASGNEENPFVEPERYAIEKPLSIDFNLYQTGPLGQIYFPSAHVGYSKVTVKDLAPEGAPATGHSVNEFYTAKDFPTIVRTTGVQQSPKEVPFPPFYYEYQLNAAQGFSVELNDMHGKQKSSYSYPPNGSMPVSGVLYKYHTDPENDARLSNEVLTLEPATGDTVTELVGVDYEFFADARQHTEESYLPSVAFNLDYMQRGPAPIFVPTLYPGYVHNFERVSTITTTKVIYRSGLLQETETFDNGAIIANSNLLRDRESGEVVLQSVNNGFDDRIYQLTYPARWVRDNKGMNGAYRNSDLTLATVTVRDGSATIPSGRFQDFLTQGDELLCIEERSATPSSDGSTFGPTDEYLTAWVMNVNATDNVAYLIDRKGDKFPSGKYRVRVLRSGYRNVINAHAGTFSVRNQPFAGGKLSLPTTGILNAQATEFSNHWQTYGLFESAPPTYSCSCSHSQIVKRNAVDLLGELVNTLFTRGDNKRSGVRMTPSYSTGAAFVSARFGNSPVTYDGERSGSMSRGFFSSGEESPCELNIRMADGVTPFPDTIVSFTIDSRSFDDGDGACNDIQTATGTITYLGQAPVQQSLASVPARPRLTARVTISSCIPLIDCRTEPSGPGEIKCLTSGRTTINPFVMGVLGNWRPLAQYVFATEVKSEERLRTSGTYSEFDDFFTPFPLRHKTPRNPNWIAKDRLITIDNYGRNIESKDALGNFTSELYGYGFSLTTATALNAQHRNIAFDGFEDYNFANQPTDPFNACPLKPHFKPTEFDALDTEVSHTGTYSLPVSSNTFYSRNFAAQFDRPVAATDRVQYNADNSVVIPTFTPTPGDFHLSVWVRKKTPETATGTTEGGSGLLNQIATDLFPAGNLIPGIAGSLSGLVMSGDVVLTARSSSGSNSTIGTFSAEGPTVDGWQQLNGKFTIPPNTASLTVNLKSNGSKTWFDDLRIQPFNSVMKTYVYDPLSLRLMAELDENNFATYCVYDQQKQLVATKKETEEGIFTVVEARTGTSKIVRP